mgnify:CR=1 FL=1
MLPQCSAQVHHDIRPDIFRDGAQKYDETALTELLKDTSRPIFIAEEAGKVLGYCFCIFQQHVGHSVMTDIKTLYIDDLCVDETCRGKGVATALFEHIRGYASELGFDVITLNVWCGNDRAMAFYKKMGMTDRNITMELPL